MKTRTLFSLGLLAAFVAGLLSVRPIARAVESFGTSSCTSTQPCIGGINAGLGSGAIGYSAAGTGIVGQTKAAKSSSNFGVWGKDASTSGTANAGVFGSSPRGAGVIGQTMQGIGVNGVLKGPIPANPKFSPAGVEASDNSASNNNAVAFIGVSTNNNAVYGEADSSSNQVAAFLSNAPNGAAIFYGSGSGSNAVVMDTSGNIETTGLIYTSGGCNSGCDRRRHVNSASVTAAAPTIEDSGEAHMSNGAAFVTLDPHFANAIDLRSNYLVFVTPEGDTRGLYVTHRTPSGFIVREIEGGRSTLDFAYRIVAHPYGATAQRLPFVAIAAPARPHAAVTNATP